MDFDYTDDIAEVPVLDEMLGIGESMDLGEDDISLDDLPDVDSYFEGINEISETEEIERNEELEQMLQEFEETDESEEPEVKELVKVKIR